MTPQSREAELLEQAQEARREHRFRNARELYKTVALDESLSEEARRKGRQGWSLCTYKDTDLPPQARLRAFEALGPAHELASTADQETLGLAAAIHKQLWRHYAGREDLERSLVYYVRGHRVGPEHDDGYTSINAAFVMDELAHIEEQISDGAGGTSDVASERREEAQRIRKSIIDVVGPRLGEPDPNWWQFATVCEAQFGLRDYVDAEKTIAAGLEQCPPPDWERRSMAEQLAALARNRGLLSTGEFGASPAGRVIAALVGGANDEAVLDSVYVGKVGLALSGGGFRASLYHLGVLAKLAELDVLRRVNVLSCVSGGSILGTHFYLAVRALLQAKSDDQIAQDDYIALVQWLEREFLAGVEKNIRTRIAESFPANVRMVLSPGYSRTLRAGQLFEKHLFAGVPEDEAGLQEWLAELDALKGGFPLKKRRRAPASPRNLSGLFVHPKGEDPWLRPRDQNWLRKNKVPDLILNATTLNTGHCWQFTASWMGEAPASVEEQINDIDWLGRMYYAETPVGHIRLGDAVAASAAVPGVFEPLALRSHFPDLTVRLVDGGVYDNQGIFGLLDQDCAVCLVSDASAQIGSIDDPSPSLFGVPLRANSVPMSRVRTEQYKKLTARSKAGLLHGMMFVHLRQGLKAQPVDWVGTDLSPQEPLDLITGPAIDPAVQALVSELRTDLDSFSEVEAFALMTLGYRMAERAFADGGQLATFPTDPAPERPSWRFLEVEKDMGKPPGETLLGYHLEVGRSKTFRAWYLSRPLRGLAYVVAITTFGLAAWSTWRWRNTFLSVGTLGSIVFALLGIAVVGKYVMRIAFDSTLQQLLNLVLSYVAWLAANLHLRWTDRLFLRAGRVRRVLGRPNPRSRR